MDVFIELHVPDFAAAEEFYSLLGFRALRREDDYLAMEKDGSVINFYGGSGNIFSHSYFGNFPKDTKKGYAVEIGIFVDDVEELYERINGKIRIVDGLKNRKWGAKDFRAEDPFGFYVRVSERYDLARRQ